MKEATFTHIYASIVVKVRLIFKVRFLDSMIINFKTLNLLARRTNRNSDETDLFLCCKRRIKANSSASHVAMSRVILESRAGYNTGL
jgi:hypothetical protein